MLFSKKVLHVYQVRLLTVSTYSIAERTRETQRRDPRSKQQYKSLSKYANATPTTTAPRTTASLTCSSCAATSRTYPYAPPRCTSASGRRDYWAALQRRLLLARAGSWGGRWRPTRRPGPARVGGGVSAPAPDCRTPCAARSATAADTRWPTARAKRKHSITDRRQTHGGPLRGRDGNIALQTGDRHTVAHCAGETET